MKKPGFVQDYSMDVGGFSRQVAAVGGALGGGKIAEVMRERELGEKQHKFFFFLAMGKNGIVCFRIFSWEDRK